MDRGTQAALLRICYDRVPGWAGKAIGKHKESKQKLPLDKARLKSAPSDLQLPFVLILRCLCSSRETMGSLEHK